MTAVYNVEEMWDSREGPLTESELFIFDVMGVGDDGDENELGALAEVLLYVEEEIEDEVGRFGALYRGVPTVKQRGGLRWLVEVEYTALPRSKPSSVIGFEVEVGTSMVKRLLSLGTINVYARAGETAPNLRGAINVMRDRVEGCDVPVREARFALRKWIAPATMTFAWWDAIYRLAGKVNSNTFCGMAAGEVLFEGANASGLYDVTSPPEAQKLVEVPFRFRFSENINDVTVNGIEHVSKQGWDYMHPYFEEIVDDAAALVLMPTSLHVDRVIERASFAPLATIIGI